MAASSGTVRLLGNLAAVMVVATFTAYAVDWALPYAGFQPVALCAMLHLIDRVAVFIGLLLAVVGFVMWAASSLKSEAGLAMLIGGFVVGLLPEILAGSLGQACVP